VRPVKKYNAEIHAQPAIEGSASWLADQSKKHPSSLRAQFFRFEFAVPVNVRLIE
jgi:hypothetical protein